MVYCRAMKVTGGDVQAGAKTLHEGDPVARDQWLDLAQNATIVVKEAASGREVKLSGPGRARACVGKDMQTWLISGYFDALTIGAEPAGSLRILATPYGAIRFGAARVRATVKTDGLDLEVDAGSVEVVPEATRTVLRDAGASVHDPKGVPDAGSPRTTDGGASAATPLYKPIAITAGERVKLRGTADLGATLCISVTGAWTAVNARMTAAAGDKSAAFGNLAEELTKTESARRLTCAWAYAARGGLRGIPVADAAPPVLSKAFQALPEDPDLPKD